MTDRSSDVGLTSAEAASRLARDGPNRLPPPARPSGLRRFVGQLTSFFAVMLWVASVLAVLADLPELAVAIALVVLVNSAFSFVQEGRADRAAERLGSLLPMRVTVLRDGRRQDIDAADVVVGDLLVLGAGDRIPADATVVDAAELQIDTSLLTGESVAGVVGDGDVVFAGTFVVEGEGDATVTATGTGTRLAGIARMTTSTSSPSSPLTLALHGVVRAVGWIAVGVGVAFFLIALALGNGASEGFVFAIGVTVALVPEALLPTVTLSLAWGAEQMAKRNVLVRHLEAVETLGSTTFICTDKTGTLTCNQMTIVEAWTPAGVATAAEPGYQPSAPVAVDRGATAAVVALAVAAARCSNGYAHLAGDRWVPHGDAMEVAIDVLARRVGIDADARRGAEVVRRRFPFDPRRRRMSVVVGDAVAVKGAPDSLLALCTPGSAVDAARVAVDRLVGRGLRVLAVAGRTVGDDLPATAAEAERDLELHGLLAMEDPPRPDVADVLEACRSAGIKVAMITGDHPSTAAAIATEVGLRAADGLVVGGSDLPEDDADLGQLVDRDGIVVARVSPEDKVRIARALRARGHVVAMTGDGVNDGPALHEADVGIAMGASGTDVAREAADLVLLDDHFATIVAGVEQGRATFLNMRRFLTYHLTDNVAELTPFVVWALSGGSIPLALGVLQILALDIGTDTLSATALGAEPPNREVMARPPVSGRLLNSTVLRRAFGVLGPTVAASTMAAFFAVFLAAGWRPGDDFPAGATLAGASGAAFMTVVLAQTANAFACRSSTRWPGDLGWTSNRLLIPAASVELAVSLLVLWVGPVADELGHASPPAIGWAVAFAAAGLVLVVDAWQKRRRRRR